MYDTMASTDCWHTGHAGSGDNLASKLVIMQLVAQKAFLECLRTCNARFPSAQLVCTVKQFPRRCDGEANGTSDVHAEKPCPLVLSRRRLQDYVELYDDVPAYLQLLDVVQYIDEMKARIRLLEE